MRWSSIGLTFLAPLYVLAEVAFTNDAYNGITAGSPFTLTWSGDGTPATISLLHGPEDMMTMVDMVASGAEGSSYTWTPPSTQSAGLYALSIFQSGDTNYSPTFQLTNNAVPPPTTSSDESASTPAAVTQPQNPTVPATTPAPPYPTGPSNVTALAAGSSIAAALPNDGPRTAVLPPGSSAPFVGGGEKSGGFSGAVGALIFGALVVRWAL